MKKNVKYIFFLRLIGTLNLPPLIFSQSQTLEKRWWKRASVP